MKKQLYFLITLIALGLTSQAVSAKGTKPETVATPQTEVRLQQIESRVQEIKAMDKSHLTGAERKALRNELLGMKKEARAMTSGGVYLSVGAIIIIILVLLLIL
jgi:hypothetical protein